MTSYIDTHIHLDRLETLGSQLGESRNAGIGAWIVPGIAPDHWSELMAIAEQHVGVYAAPGIHPQAAGSCQKAHLENLRDLLQHPRSVAVGEVGLDRQAGTPWQTQEEVFIDMIRLARETNKPLLIHARRSTSRILELLHREGGGRLGGIFHAFSGSLETARKIIDMGFVLGIGGVLTFSNARRLPEVVREVPAEALVLETDAPDLTPEPYRGRPNRPVYLGLIAERLAGLRGWSLAETAQVTTANACRILKLPSHLDSMSILEGNNREQS